MKPIKDIVGSLVVLSLTAMIGYCVWQGSISGTELLAISGPIITSVTKDKLAQINGK